MNIFVISSNFFDTGVFGVYSSIKRARMAIEHYCKEEPNIANFWDTDSYTYEIITKNDEIFYIEITSDLLDYEFVRGELDEND